MVKTFVPYTTGLAKDSNFQRRPSLNSPDEQTDKDLNKRILSNVFCFWRDTTDYDTANSNYSL